MQIEEIYKKYPCAKKKAEENIAFWDGPESLETQWNGELEACVKVTGGEEDLYRFFELLVHYDAFLLKENEITPWEETKRNRIVEQLTEKHLGFWHSALYSSPKVDDPYHNQDQFLDDQSYWKIFCEDQF